MHPHVADSESRATRLAVLIIGRADEATLRDKIAQRARDAQAELLVVVPALHSPLDPWGPDQSAARQAARLHVQEYIDCLQRYGIQARGMVGYASPLRAVAEAVGHFDPDELIVAASTGGRANSFAQDVAARAAERFGLRVEEIAIERLETAPTASNGAVHDGGA